MSSSLLPPPPQTRLVTIVAHVDHGKTTLADTLIESNGIITERLAGTIRYLDFDSEEQRRGITMRTSTIALRHVYTPPGGGGKKEKETCVLHLLDSPGHVDFAPEVTTSLLLADTALLVIDAVEGMCARTHSILRESHAHSLKPILVINKMDRLCLDLKLSVRETYLRVRGLIESVNAVCANMVMRSKLERMEREQQKDEQIEAAKNKKEEDEEDEETLLWTFNPSLGNVVFASALHGWGFTLPSLARHLFKASTVQIKPMLLKQLLFDENVKYRSDDGKVLKKKSEEEDLNLFEEFGLKPIWDIYESVSDAALNAAAMNNGNQKEGGAANKTKITAETPGMDSVLSLLQTCHTSPLPLSTNNNQNSILCIPQTKTQLQQILQRTGATNEESVSRTLLRRYRPLSNAVLDVVCEIGFNPCESIQGWRKEILSLNDVVENGSSNNEEENVKDAMMSIVPSSSTASASTTKVYYPPSFLKAYSHLSSEITKCNPSSEVVMAHVTKFLVTDPSYVTDPKGTIPIASAGSDEKKNIIMGLARVISGTLHSDQDYHVFGPRYKPSFTQEETITAPPTKKIKLYLLMGSSFIQVPYVPSGHICAIYNLEDLQYKSVSLSNTYDGMLPFGSGRKGLMKEAAKTRPLVKVNVEAVNSADTDLLEKGLVKLCLADSAVEVIATSRGERILSCLGEIHLEQSILDLKRTYCRRGDHHASTTTNGTTPASSTTTTPIGSNKDKHDNDDTIKLRISEPIVEFGESTTWFEKEHKLNEYTKFWSDNDKVGTSIQPVRQVTIPPYCDEEGLKYAKRGRSRCILSGRCAALSVRVVPLSRWLYDCLRLKRVDVKKEKEKNGGEESVGEDDGEDGHYVEDILEIGRALKCDATATVAGGDGADNGTSSSASTAQSILDTLSQAICHIDSNGNAFIESRGIARGECVKAVLSDKGEIYVPATTTNATKTTTTAAANMSKQQMSRTSSDQSFSKSGDENGGLEDGDDELDESDRHGKDVYEAVRFRIGQGGLMGMKDCDSVNSEEEGEENNDNSAAADAAALEIWKSEMRGSAVAGFQLAMRAGALCEEPVRGVLVILEGVEIAMASKKQKKNAKENLLSSSSSLLFQSAKPLSGGMVVAALRSGIRCALLTRPARLVEGHLRLTLHSSFAGLGPLYAVLSKRRGKVISDDMVEGTDLIRITASIPQAESFHLAPELLNESSGEVTAPELVFSHWEVLDEDPFWIPTSLEEREDYGEIVMNGDLSTGLDNNALKYIRMVRGRKGLLVDSSKIVVAAEKQRTLARKK